MNNELQVVQFDGIPLSVIDQNGEGWMIGEEIGKALEYSDPRDSISKIFERNREELEEYSVTVKLTATDGKQYDTRVYNEEGVMMIGFLSKQPKAVAFRKWAVKILKAYRHQELAQQNTELLDTQRKLITAQESQIEFIRKRASEVFCGLQKQIETQSRRLESSANNTLRHRAELARAVRAQRPIEATEKQEIIDLFKQGWALRSLEVWFYRSPSIIRRTLREAEVIA